MLFRDISICDKTMFPKERNDKYKIIIVWVSRGRGQNEEEYPNHFSGIGKVLIDELCRILMRCPLLSSSFMIYIYITYIL